MSTENSTNNTITNSKTQDEMNEKEYLFIGELFDELDERGMIIHTDLRETIKAPLIQMIDFLSYKGIDVIQNSYEAEIEEAKQYLRENLTELLANRTRALQGNLTEYQFWKIKQKLQEALHKGNPYVYQNIFGIKPKGEEEKEKYTFESKYDFSSALYLDMGLYSGAFAIADKAGDRLIVQYNRKYQKDEYEDIPFIEIPTRYNYPIYDTIKQSDALRKVLDAMYISIRQAQSLKERTENSPEFYHYMPNLIDEKAQKSLPLFEKAMSKDGFKFVYCTVGEVLFHLYAWRMLVRQIQVEGIEHKVDIKKDNFENFNINNYDFWEEVSGTHLPEDDWIKKLRTKFKDQVVITSNGEKIPLENEWDKYKENVYDNRNYNGTFRMIEEYERMGLIKKERDGTTIFTREFLEFVRYTIHVAQKKLGWDIEEIAALHGKKKSKQKDNILRSLYRIERRLDIYYSEPKKIPKFREDSGEIHSLYPTIENLEEYIVIKGKGKIQHIIEECFRIIAKHYLLQDEDGVLQSDVSVKELLKRLHQRCRFPIIPYYFDLAVGVEHHPREHLVFCLWDSKDNPPIELESDNGTTEESGVIFVSLTINPIWKIKSEYHLMKNGKSIHCTAALSEESYIRIHRLYDFFRMLATPIVDKVFYGNLIKKAQEYDILEREIAAFNHELSKITANIFNASLFNLDELYIGENHSEILNQLASKVKLPHKFTPEQVKKWAVIPNRTRFDVWAHIFKLWAGDNRSLILDFGGKHSNKLGEIIDICSKYGKQMHTASSVKNAAKEESTMGFREYEEFFDEEMENLFDCIKSEDRETQRILEEFHLLAGNSNNLEQKESVNHKNAFLRTLIANFVNINEHCNGDYKLIISQQDEDLLEFTFLNKYRPKFRHIEEKSRGTRPVIESCLKLIEGDSRLKCFKRVDSNERNRQNLRVEDGEYVWKTQFIVNISKILSK